MCILCVYRFFQGLSALLLVYNRKHGLRTSGLQFLFWLLATICGTPQFRSEILEANRQTPEPFYFYISYLIYYPFIILMLLLNCFVDKPPTFSEYPRTAVSIFYFTTKLKVCEKNSKIWTLYSIVP